MRGRPGVTGSRRAGGREWHLGMGVNVDEWRSHRFLHPSAKSTNALLDFSIHMTVWEWAGCGYRGFPPPRSVVVGAGESGSDECCQLVPASDAELLEDVTHMGF